MMHGTYIGPRQELRGCTALLRYPDMHAFHADMTQRWFLAQFDDLARFGEETEEKLALGWHDFELEDFAVRYSLD